MRKILPILLALLGLAAGAGAGFALRPPPAEPEAGLAPCGPETTAPPSEISEEGKALHEYVKMSNQFVVPVVEAGRVAALVILSLSLEAEPESTQDVYKVEPKLRDGFLKVLFDHANAGGFSGAFTGSQSMESLRKALLEVAQKVLGPRVTNVLIGEIVRQDK